MIAAIFANAMPALLWRWGHIASESHFLLIGALALYLFSLKKPAWRGVELWIRLSDPRLSDEHLSLWNGRHRLALRVIQRR